MFDAIGDVLKAVTGVGVVGLVVSVAVGLLKQVGVVRRMHLDSLLDDAASRVVNYVQDVSRETGASGAEQREEAVRVLQGKTGVDAAEAEERVRAAYQKMKAGRVQ